MHRWLASPITLLLLRLLLLLLVSMAPSFARAQDAPPFPVNQVDPRIGTGGAGWTLGQNNPAAQYPFGPLRLGPDTTFDRVHIPWSHYNGYAWTDTHVRAFSHTHVVGAGLPDFANFGVMALRSAVPSTDHITRYGYRSLHAHETETMYPGYYSTHLITHRTLAELVAGGNLAGMHRYTYEAGGPVTLLLDVCHDTDNNNERCFDASINFRQIGTDIEVDASLRYAGSLTGRNGKGIWIYLHARIQSSSGPMVGSGIWAAGQVYPGVSSRAGETSESLGAYFYFGDAAAETIVTMSVGLSFVSNALAQANMNTQLQDRSFDRVKADTYLHWADVLMSTATVQATRPKDLIKFYTALYRTFMSPTDYTESDGSYVGKDDLVHNIADRRYYSDMSLWDTYRTQNPWLNLVRPDVGGDVVNSLVLMYQQGHGLSRWPIANVFTGCMFGDNADILFLDAYRKGIHSFNLSLAYEAMRANAMSSQPHDGRGNIEIYMQMGFIPIEHSGTGTPNTLAYAYNDWCIAEVANILGLSSDEQMFRQRGQNWRNVFSTDDLFMCARFLNGTFKCPDHRFNVPYDENFVEGNTWHYSWDVPHDLDNFVLTWPSPTSFVEKLEHSLYSSTQQGLVFEENWLPNPFYWQGNEHNLLFPWEFSKAGRADLTQYWTRWLLENRYTERPDGLPGNDDYGTMSAWLTFGYLGFYPLAGADWYFVGSPMIDQATLRVGFDQSLTVIVLNNSPTNVYVDSVTINGIPLAEPFMSHAQITSGNTTIVFSMSSTADTPFNVGYAKAWQIQYDQRKAASR